MAIRNNGKPIIRFSAGVTLSGTETGAIVAPGTRTPQARDPEPGRGDTERA